MSKPLTVPPKIMHALKLKEGELRGVAQYDPRYTRQIMSAIIYGELEHILLHHSVIYRVNAY